MSSSTTNSKPNRKALAPIPSPVASGSKRPAPSPASSRTVSPDIVTVDWVKNGGRYFPFPMPHFADDGTEEPREVLDLQVKGVVQAAFLTADALSHTVAVEISTGDIEHIKSVVCSAPKHEESGFRWPFSGVEAKFVSKVDLDKDFANIWSQEDSDSGGLPVSEVEEGVEVVVDFTPIRYLGKRAKGGDTGFGPGCTLRLNSILLTPRGAQRRSLNFESPKKKRKVDTSSL